MFNFFKKKRNKKQDLSRRNFLRGAAILPAGVVAGMASSVDGDELKTDYLKKTWVEDGITYNEYELPQHIQPFFKHPDGRGRAIAVPIYNLDKDRGSVVDGGRSGGICTKESFINNLKGYVDMHRHQDPKEWANPYCYIVNVKGHDNLFGAMINKSELKFESNAYTVYG